MNLRTPCSLFSASPLATVAQVTMGSSFGGLLMSIIALFATGSTVFVLFFVVRIVRPTLVHVSGLGAALLFVYAAGISINLYRGRSDIDCGCGGPESAQRLSGWLISLGHYLEW